MSQYAGANWIKRQSYGENMSPLGEVVADFLGDVFAGIYHLDPKALSRVDWSNNHHIEFSLGWRCLSTTDYDELTRIVVLGHDRMIRIQIDASTHKYLRLMFHQRSSRTGDYSTRYPTMEDHVAEIRAQYPERTAEE